MAKAAKKHPSEDELRKQIGALMLSLHQSELACVIVGASFVDHCLASILQHYLADCDTAIEILQPGRPLGEYSARAKLAYSLGLIQKSILTDAMKIAEIRNKFAHKLFSAHFEDADIKVLCDGLNTRGQQIDGPRERFQLSVMSTSFEILLLASEVQQLEVKGENKYPTWGRDRKDRP